MVDNDGENSGKTVSQSSESRARKNSRFKKTAPRPEPKPIEFIDCPESVSDRIDFIADIMSELQWVRGKTGKKLAKHWGLSESTLGGYAAEASRRVTAPADEIRREVTIRGLQRLAHADDKSFAAIGKLLADVSGANAPNKQEIALEAGTATPGRAKDIMALAFTALNQKKASDIEVESDSESESESAGDESGS